MGSPSENITFDGDFTTARFWGKFENGNLPLSKTLMLDES